MLSNIKIPKDHELEEALIGYIIHNRKSIEDLQIKQEIFDHPVYKSLYKTAIDCYNKHNVVDVALFPENDRKTASSIPSKTREVALGAVDKLSGILTLRRCRDASVGFLQALERSEATDDHAKELEKKVYSINEPDGSTVYTAKDATISMLELAEKCRQQRMNSVETGIPVIDKYLEKLVGEEYVVIGGRPGGGKSVLVSQIETHNLKRGLPGLSFRLEMSKGRSTIRAVSNMSQVEMWKITGKIPSSEHEMDKVAIYAEQYSELPLFIDESRVINEREIYRKVAKFKRDHDIKWCTVDYLQLVKASNRKVPKVEQLEEISRTFKQIGLDLGVVMIVAAQLNRGNVIDNRWPEPEDFKGCGGIEQDADVIFLLADARTKEYKEDMHKNQYDHPIVCRLAKQRSGATVDLTSLKFNKKTATIYEHREAK